MPLDTANLGFQPEFETLAQWSQRLSGATAPQSGTIEDIYTRFMTGQATDLETRTALEALITSKGSIQPKPGLGSFSSTAAGAGDIVAEWKAQKGSGPPPQAPGNDFPAGQAGAGMKPEQNAAFQQQLQQAQAESGGPNYQYGDTQGSASGAPPAVDTVSLPAEPPGPGVWGSALWPYHLAGFVSIEDVRASLINGFVPQGVSLQDATQAADEFIKQKQTGSMTPGYNFPIPGGNPAAPPPGSFADIYGSGSSTSESDPWAGKAQLDQAALHRQAVAETPQYAWDRHVLAQFGKGGVAPAVQGAFANRGDILSGLAPLYGVGGAPSEAGGPGGPSYADYFQTQASGYPTSVDTRGRLRRLAGTAYALPGQEMTLEDQQFLSPFLGAEGAVNQSQVNNAFLSAMLAGVAPEARSGTKGLYNRLYSQQQIQEPETPWLQYAQRKGYF